MQLLFKLDRNGEEYNNNNNNNMHYSSPRTTQ